MYISASACDEDRLQRGDGGRGLPGRVMLPYIIILARESICIYIHTYVQRRRRAYILTRARPELSGKSREKRDTGRRRKTI